MSLRKKGFFGLVLLTYLACVAAVLSHYFDDGGVVLMMGCFLIFLYKFIKAPTK